MEVPIENGDRGLPPPPSPLTGCYLLIVVGEPHTQEHKDIILQRIAKGLLSWDPNSCHVDLEKELTTITEQAPEGEEARHGERLIQFASENLVTEILIHPASSTLIQCARNLLSSFTKHRHIIHSGYTFAANGSWILQDGTFSLADLSEALQEIEVQRVMRAYEKTISIDLHCAPEGEWVNLPKESFVRTCNLRLNPNDVLTSGSVPIAKFINYLSQFLYPADLTSLLESSDVVGNIRFSHPTLYVFPGGQGDAALFGINGFNMLLDGGFSRKSCFWDFVRHLDRLDAVLMTRLNNSNLNGINAVLRRKRANALYPQLGHFFCNIQERRTILSPDGDKDKDPLIVNLLEQGHEVVDNLRALNLRPQACYRDSEPINLYHKVGHGTLDMYVLSPAKDSKEVREFMQKWNNNDAKLFSYRKDGKDFTFPLQNLVSICALLVWQPENASDTITRILYPGSTPQQKIFEGLEKLKHLEFMKHPVCSNKTLSASSSIIGLKKQAKANGVEKIISAEKKSALIESVKKPKAENGVKADITAKAEVIKKSDSTESEKVNGTSIETKKTEINGKDNVENDIKKVEDKIDSKAKPKAVETKTKTEHKSKIDTKSSKPSTITSRTNKSTERKPKPPVDKKPSPTTPKKTIDSKPKTPVKQPHSKASPPSATPAKSTKDANNRKVVESKNKPLKKETKPEKQIKEAKTERKPISRRPKTTSSPGRGAGSPAKIKPISLPVKVKLEKEATTDSSTVSSPSADQETTLKKIESKLTPEEIEQIKALELADLKEELEVVNEIEAVFRKGEGKKLEDSATRAVMTTSIVEQSLEAQEEEEEEEYLIVEKEEVDQVQQEEDTSLVKDESEIQKHLRDSEESEKKKEEEKVELIAADSCKVLEIISPDKVEEPKITSPEEKPELSSEKKTTDAEDQIQDQNFALESQPDEKFSTTVESGATTAPTLPEDERIPLDEIKEDQVIEEKHVKEDTKEKEVTEIVIEPAKVEEAVAATPPKLPVIAGIKFDTKTHIRDIVKTPDEVADLPMHEEADYQTFDNKEEVKEIKEDVKEVIESKDVKEVKEEVKEEAKKVIEEVKDLKDLDKEDKKEVEEVVKELEEVVKVVEEEINNVIKGTEKAKEVKIEVNEEIEDLKDGLDKDELGSKSPKERKQDVALIVASVTDVLKETEKGKEVKIEVNEETEDLNDGLDKDELGSKSPKEREQDVALIVASVAEVLKETEKAKEVEIEVNEETESLKDGLDKDELGSKSPKEREQDVALIVASVADVLKGTEKAKEVKIEVNEETEDLKDGLKENGESPLKPEIVTVDSKSGSPLKGPKILPLDKHELGSKSPKEREQDVALIVASVAEVLKSDVPLEEIEYVQFYPPSTLRETHITTVESPVTDVTIEVALKTKENATNLSASVVSEEKELEETMEVFKGEKDIQPVKCMLVTASSEDGGEETVICPTGSIKFTNGEQKIIENEIDTKVEEKQVSGKNTPEIKAEKDSQNIHSGKETPELTSADIKESPKDLSGKSTPEIVLSGSQAEPKDQSEKISPEVALTDNKQSPKDISGKSTPEIAEIADLSKEVSGKTTPDVTVPDSNESPKDLSEKATPDVNPTEKKDHSENITPDITTTVKEDLSRKATPESDIIENKDSPKVISGKTTPEVNLQETKDSSKEISGKTTPDIVLTENKDLSGKQTPEVAVQEKTDSPKELSGKTTPEIVITEKKDLLEKVTPEVDLQEKKDSPKDISGKTTPEIGISEKKDLSEKLILDPTTQEQPNSPKELSGKTTSDIVSTEKKDLSGKMTPEAGLHEKKDLPTTLSGKVTPEVKLEENKDSPKELTGKTTPDIVLTENKDLSGKATPEVAIQEKTDSSKELSGKTTPEIVISEKEDLPEKITPEVDIEENKDSPKTLSGKTTPEIITIEKKDLQEETCLLNELSGKTIPDIACDKKELSGKATPEIDLQEKKDTPKVLSGKSTPEIGVGEKKDSLKELSEKTTPDNGVLEIKDSPKVSSGKSTPEVGLLENKDSSKEFSGKTTPEVDLPVDKDSPKVLSGKITPETKLSDEKEILNNLSGKATPEIDLIESKEIPKDLSGAATPEPNTVIDKDLSGKSTLDKKDNKDSLKDLSGKATPEITVDKTVPTEVNKEVSGKSTPDIKTEVDTLISTPKDLSGKATPVVLDETKLSGKNSPELKEHPSGKVTPVAKYFDNEKAMSETQIDEKQEINEELFDKETAEIKSVEKMSGKSTPDLKESKDVIDSTADVNDLSSKLTSELVPKDSAKDPGKSTPEIKELDESKLSSGKITPEVTSELHKEQEQKTSDIKEYSEELHEIKKDILDKTSPLPHSILDDKSSGKSTPEIKETPPQTDTKATDSAKLDISGKSTPDVSKIDRSGKSTPDIKDLKPTDKIALELKDLSGKSSPEITVQESKEEPDRKLSVEEKDVTVLSGKETPEVKDDSKSITSDMTIDTKLDISGKTTPEKGGTLESSGKTTPEPTKEDLLKSSPELSALVQDIRTEEKLESGKTTPDIQEEKADSPEKPFKNDDKLDTLGTESSNKQDAKPVSSGKTTPEQPYLATSSKPTSETHLDAKADLSGKSSPDVKQEEKVQSSREATPELQKEEEKSSLAAKVETSGKTSPDVIAVTKPGIASPDDNKEAKLASGKATPETHLKEAVDNVAKLDALEKSSGKTTPEIHLEAKEVSGKSSAADKLNASGTATPEVHLDAKLNMSGKSSPDVDKNETLNGLGIGTPESKVETKTSDDKVASGKGTPDSGILDVKTDFSGKSTPEVKSDLKSLDNALDVKDSVSGKSTPDVKLDTSGNATAEIYPTIDFDKVKTDFITCIDLRNVNKLETLETSHLDSKSDMSGKSSPQLQVEKEDAKSSGKSSPQLNDESHVSSGKTTPEVHAVATEKEEALSTSARATPDGHKEDLHLETKGKDSSASSPDIKQECKMDSSGKATPEIHLDAKQDLSGKSTPEVTLSQKIDSSEIHLESKQVISDVKEEVKEVVTGKSTPDVLTETIVESSSGKATPDIKTISSDLSGKATPEVPKPDLSGKSTPDVKAEDKPLSGKATPDVQSQLKTEPAFASAPRSDLSGKSTPDVKDASGKSTPDLKKDVKKTSTSHVIHHEETPGIMNGNVYNTEEDFQENGFFEKSHMELSEKTIKEMKQETKVVEKVVSKVVETTTTNDTTATTSKTIDDISTGKDLSASTAVEFSQAGPSHQGTKDTFDPMESSTDNLCLSGKSTPDIADVEHQQQQLKDTSSPLFGQTTQIVTTEVTKHLSTASKTELRSSTPGSDDLDQGGISSPPSDISSGQMSRAPHQWGPASSDEKQGYSDDDEDDDVPDSPMSTTSQIAHSPLQHHHPQGGKGMDLMSASFYGELPDTDTDIMTTSMYTSVIEEHAEVIGGKGSTLVEAIKEEKVLTTDRSVSPSYLHSITTAQFRSVLPHEETETLEEIQKDDEIVAEKGVIKDVDVEVNKNVNAGSTVITTTTTIKTVTTVSDGVDKDEESRSHLHEVTKAKFTVSGAVPSDLDDDTNKDSDDQGLDGVDETEEEMRSHLHEVTKAKFGASGAVTEHASSEVVEEKTETKVTSKTEPELNDAKKTTIETTEESRTHLHEVTKAKFIASVVTTTDDDMDDQTEEVQEVEDSQSCGLVIGSVGVGGGAISNNHLYELTSAKYCTGADLDDPIKSWGKPLGLPSPAPVADNKGTPKKERKITSNLAIKNKLNDDKRRSESPGKGDKKTGKRLSPVYVDLAYVPHHGNSNYAYAEFFKKVRARYYVFSGIEPSKEVYDALLEAKQTWEDKELEVTIIPTYDTDVLGYWVSENEDILAKFKIDLSPSASRCTINLQDHETSCSAYRLEF